jgi:hypothetical protein
MTAMLVTLTLFAAGGPAVTYPGCHTEECAVRVQRRTRASTTRRWKRIVRPYSAWLRSTRNCESGSAGGYSLSTTGNGFWFAYQHTASSWYAAGGRERSGRPAGARGLQPEPLEQDFRAVLTLRQQGRGAWPICG